MKKRNVIILNILLALTIFSSVPFQVDSSEIDDKRYVGCYKDKMEEPAFLVQVDLYGETNINNCALSCINLKFPYTGLQNGDTCFCGKEDYGIHGKCFNDTCQCDVSCEGAHMQICGGMLANSVYITECPHGWYTTDCNMPCHCLDNKKCDMTSGHCNGPCDPGWQGPVCNQTCDSGFFGNSCSEECRCEFDSECFHINGSCSGYCGPGWLNPPECTTACDGGTFGQNCTGVCHCEKGACDAVSGECPGDCAAGWSDPPNCQTPCFGEYGVNCEEECRCHLAEECHPQTGNCSGDCADGWEDPPFCNTACQDGNFGFDCQHVCHCKDGIPCHTSTGYCPGECADGWTGHPTCQTPANERYMGCYEDREDNRTFPLLWTEDITTIESCIDICYSLERKYAGLQNGIQCYCGGEEYKAHAECQDKTCYCNTPCEGNNSTACGGSLANSVYAICPVGWWGGTECNTQCGHCIDNEVCDMLTGICENGCAEDWHTIYCSLYGCAVAFDVIYNTSPWRIAYCGGYVTYIVDVESKERCVDLACKHDADTVSYEVHYERCLLYRCRGPVDFTSHHREVITLSKYEADLK